MVGLDPNLKLLGYIRLSLARGQSLKASISRYCTDNTGRLAKQLAGLLISYQQNKTEYGLLDTVSQERRLVLDIIWRGLKGETILKHLPQLEFELELKSHERLDHFLKTLPIKVLLVVILFHFPALLILSLIPILNQLLEVTQ